MTGSNARSKPELLLPTILSCLKKLTIALDSRHRNELRFATSAIDIAEQPTTLIVSVLTGDILPPKPTHCIPTITPRLQLVLAVEGSIDRVHAKGGLF